MQVKALEEGSNRSSRGGTVERRVIVEALTVYEHGLAPGNPVKVLLVKYVAD